MVQRGQQTMEPGRVGHSPCPHAESTDPPMPCFPPKTGGVYPSQALRGNLPAKTPKAEPGGQQEEAKTGKMAANTCAQATERPDLMAKFDDLLNKFWRTLASRSQTAKTSKPATHLPTAMPMISQQGCTPLWAYRVHTRRRKKARQRAGKPTRLTTPTAALRCNKHPATTNLAARHGKESLQHLHLTPDTRIRS
ncbi:Hypothetical predicted protein [Pelobates cultripes]|uniref:Uncharacterized protein n=1 Tax=Pelobates cultripes TaxID=61616 RepID=A0AAD1WVQ2_PELCU|nr:Hypothetical predicted protein [Pelobates cultripes]